MNETKVKILKICFGQEIAHWEIPMFRGAIINSLENNNILFHNHDDDGFRYAYPLIQYKRIGGKAAIVCVGEGTEAIGEFFASCNFDIMLGDRPLHLETESVKASQNLVQVWDSMFDYNIRKWLPFNKQNYTDYQQLDGIVERCQMMEKILTGNILSMAKGLGIHFEKQVEVKIKDVAEPRQHTFKGVKMMSFDAVFSSNVSLPSFVGLGKGVSQGYGMVTGYGFRQDEQD